MWKSKFLYRKYVVSVLDDKGIKTELYSCAGAGDDEPVAVHVVRVIVREIWRRDDTGGCCGRFVTRISDADVFNGCVFVKKVTEVQYSLFNYRVFNGNRPSTNSQVDSQESYQ